MKAQQFVLPERCQKCGAVFDLWYDLINKSEREMDSVDVPYAEFLCWRCRSLAQGSSKEKNSSDDFDEVYAVLEFE